MQRRDVLGLAVLWALTGVVFWNGLGGQFAWDDFPLIVNNATLQDPSRLGELLTTGFWNVSSSKADLSQTYTHVYRPLVSLALFVQHQLFGLDARGFHAVSLVLHLLIVTMVFGLLRRAGGPGTGGFVGALCGAALFAIHPTRAESVAWVSGSTELWMGLLVLAGYAVWVARPSWTVQAAVLFGLAIFAKETVIVVPAVLLVDMYARHGGIDWKRWGTATGVFGAFVAARFLLMPLPRSASDGVSELPRRVVGTLGHYVEATVWPWQPLLARGFRHTDCSGTLVVPTHTLLIGGATVAALALLCVRWRALRGKPWAFDVAWFFLFLVPVLNVIDLRAHGLAGDRFLYVPLFGASALVAALIARAWRARVPVRAAVGLMMGVVLGACATSTHRHVAHFENSAVLWRNEAQLNPENLYAVELVARQESAADPGFALSLYTTGYELATARCNTALAARFAMLATAGLVGVVPDTRQDRLGDLLDFYDRVVGADRVKLAWPEMALDMTLPSRFAEELKSDPLLVGMPHAIVTMRALRLPRARSMVERMLEAHPDHQGAWLLLARIQARQESFDEAERSIEEADRRAPNSVGAEHLANMVREARAVATMPADDEQARKLREAQVQVILQAPEAARRILAPELERRPGDPSLVLAYVRTVTADGRFDLAEAAVARAEAEAPAESDKWQQLRQALRAGEAASP
jgi:tetratricopeptide (TPR) repeat protein